MFQCTEYKLSALQVRMSKENKLNATTQAGPALADAAALGPAPLGARAMVFG